jgi:hypothetical protein
MLFAFLSDLFKSGDVTVEADLKVVSDKDKQEALQLLRQMYSISILEMPANPPEFNGTAALWAAEILYKSMQYITVRSLEVEQDDPLWKPFPEEKNAAVIYSADLCFRYLPDLFNLAVRLAPGDPLIIKIKEIALAWPYSSVGIELNGTPDEHEIICNSALLMNYADRIIEKKDKARLATSQVKEKVEAILGNFAEDLWPGYELIKT